MKTQKLKQSNECGVEKRGPGNPRSLKKAPRTFRLPFRWIEWLKQAADSLPGVSQADWIERALDAYSKNGWYEI